MITIIPSLEVMKAVTDNNIKSSGADLRRQGFDSATDLMTLANVEVLIEGVIFERIEKKLNEDHKTAFKSGYRIDNSAKGTEIGTTQAVIFVANSESKSRKVIILTDNPNDFKSICNGNIICLTPSFFIEKVGRAISNYQKKIISNIDDSLNALFFL